MAATVHASAVIVGGAGVLVRGAPGSGKTTLCRRLVAEAALAGRFAAWVADDRVALAAIGGRLLATAPPEIAGLAECRGRGIVPVPYEPAAIVRLVVDLVPPGEAERMPAEAALFTEVAGLELPRQPVPIGAGDPLGFVAAALAGIDAVVEGG